MSLIIAVNGIYQSYFNREHQGTLNPRKKKTANSNLKQDQIKTIPKLAQNSYQESAKHDKRRRVDCFASDVMSSPVRSISPSMLVTSAMSEMNRLDTHHLLVKENDLIVGIISDRDLLKCLDHDGTSSSIVKEVMSQKVLLCKTDTELRVIAQIMLEERISSIPVVDDKHILQGIVTRTDLLECIVHNMPIELWI